MKLKDMLKDVIKLNEINIKYGLSNDRFKLELSQRRGNDFIPLDEMKDIKLIENVYIEELADKLINGNWTKDYDNYYYMEYYNGYDKETYSLSITNY